jgi:hypothetical protein
MPRRKDMIRAFRPRASVFQQPHFGILSVNRVWIGYVFSHETQARSPGVLR